MPRRYETARVLGGPVVVDNHTWAIVDWCATEGEARTRAAVLNDTLGAHVWELRQALRRLARDMLHVLIRR